MHDHIQSKRKLRWVRSREGAIGGVCAGIAPILGIETWILRVIWLASILGFGSGLLIYLILFISLPCDDELDRAYDRRILGVCGRIAVRYDLEVGLVRALAIFAALSTFGISLIIYIGCYFIMPENPHRNSGSH